MRIHFSWWWNVMNQSKKYMQNFGWFISKQNSEQNKSKVHLKARIVSIIGFLRVEFLFAQFSNHCNTFAPLTQFGKFDKNRENSNLMKWNAWHVHQISILCIHYAFSFVCSTNTEKFTYWRYWIHTDIYLFKWLKCWNWA